MADTIENGRWQGGVDNRLKALEEFNHELVRKREKEADERKRDRNTLYGIVVALVGVAVSVVTLIGNLV